jgi:exonuclease VII small subunit
MERSPEENKLEKALTQLQSIVVNINKALKELEDGRTLSSSTYLMLQGDMNILKSIDWETINAQYVHELKPSDEEKNLLYWIRWIIGVIFFLIDLLRKGESSQLTDQLMGLVVNEDFGYLEYNTRLLYGPIEDFQLMDMNQLDRSEFSRIMENLLYTLKTIVQILERYRNDGKSIPINGIIES